MGKRQRHNKTSQTRAKRSALSQQVTTRHQQTDVHSITKQDRNNMIHIRSTALERSVKYFTGGLKPV